MRTLKYSILGLLMQAPTTGYDISKAFGGELGCFWSAKHSQIYPELKRLVEEGLVQYSTVIQGEKLEKKLYEITDEGKADFLQWLEQDPPLDPTPKDVFRLRSYYSQWLPEETYLDLIQKQIEKRSVKLNYLSGCLEASYGDVDPLTLTGPARGNYLVLLSAVMREQTYMEWLLKSQKLVSAWAKLNTIQGEDCASQPEGIDI